MATVKKGSKVTVQYSISRLEAQENRDHLKPFEVSFVVGKEEVLPVVERAVLGRQTGEIITLEVDGFEIFGAYDEGKVIPIPTDMLDASEPLNKGDFFHFRDHENRIHPFRVKKIEKDIVWADFNHPLGGEKFLLNLVIEKVE